MKIWIFQTGEPLHSDGGNPRPMRAMNLANALIKKGHKVTLWSSAFYHQEKKHRSRVFKKIKINKNLDIFLIPSPGYSRNISFKRLFDHAVLAFNLNKQLKLCYELPDVTFIGYPPIETAFVLSSWLKKKNIPMILDIKDQWPSVLFNSVPLVLRPLAFLALLPYFFFAKRTMRNSSAICAISKSYINWASSFSKKPNNSLNFIAPLTSPKESAIKSEIDSALSWWHEKGIRKSSTFRVIFVGSFSRGFDFDSIFEATDELVMSNVNFEFILCGDGEFSRYLSDKALKYKNIKIIEWIDEPKIIALASLSSAYIAPYKNSSDFIISLPNKIVDATRLGMPLLSPLKGEVEDLIKKNKIGLSYDCNLSLSECIKSLSKNHKLHKEMSLNSRNLYNKKFDYNLIYDGLVRNIEKAQKF